MTAEFCLRNIYTYHYVLLNAILIQYVRGISKTLLDWGNITQSWLTLVTDRYCVLQKILFWIHATSSAYLQLLEASLDLPFSDAVQYSLWFSLDLRDTLKSSFPEVNFQLWNRKTLERTLLFFLAWIRTSFDTIKRSFLVVIHQTGHKFWCNPPRI
jgi:hypothetical protein